MKKILILILIGIYLMPQNLKAQNNDAVIAAGVGAVGALVSIGVGIAAVEQLKEQFELKATQWLLKNHPEFTKFQLKTMDFNVKKISDLSSTSVITYTITEIDMINNQPKQATALGKRKVLFAYTSHGWVNEYGTNYSQIKWEIIDRNEWVNMMTAYSTLASGEEDRDKIKKSLSIGYITKKGIKTGSRKTNINFYKMNGDMYFAADYSDDKIFIYNERALGIYLKETEDLIQINRTKLSQIHNFFFGFDEITTNFVN